MKLRDFKRRIDAYVDSLQEHQDPNVVVAISGSGIGGTPCVNIRSISMGFDWDSGKIIVYTEGKLLKRE